MPYEPSKSMHCRWQRVFEPEVGTDWTSDWIANFEPHFVPIYSGDNELYELGSESWTLNNVAALNMCFGPIGPWIDPNAVPLEVNPDVCPDGSTFRSIQAAIDSASGRGIRLYSSPGLPWPLLFIMKISI